MNNEDFFDILGGLSDDIIADAALFARDTAETAEKTAVLPVTEDGEINTLNKNTVSIKETENDLGAPLIKRHRGTVKNMLLIAAAVAVFVISGFVISDSIKTGNMGLFETEKHPSDTTLSGVTVGSSSEEITSSYTEITTSEMQTTNLFTPPPVTEEPTEELTEKPTEEPTEELTGELTGESDSTTEADPPALLPPETTEAESTTKDRTESLIPPWLENLFPEMGDSSIGDGWFFLTAPVMSFYEKLPETKPDETKYTVKENISGYELEKLYGTKIIPGYIPSSSGGSVDSSPTDEVLSEEYRVYYSSDRSESFISQQFTLPAKNGSTVKITVSTEPLSLYSSEKENIDYKSVINDIPVLLLCSRVLSKTVLLNAYFEKDGLYFRVTWQGKDLDEKEFIEIIRSMM